MFAVLKPKVLPPDLDRPPICGERLTVQSTLPNIATYIPLHQACLKWTTKSRYQLAHICLWGESLGPCPELTFNSEGRASGLASRSHSTLNRASGLVPTSHSTPRGPQALSFFDIATTRSVFDLHDIGSLRRFPLSLDSSTAGFPDHDGRYVATIFPRSKYSVLVGEVMNSGEYLSIPIPTIKYSNLSGYEKISTYKLCSYGDARNSLHQLQRYKVLFHLKIYGGRGPGSKKL